MNGALDECAMEGDCYYEEGAGSFIQKAQKDDRAGDWGRSKDHYPQLKSLNGTLLPGNVRLMHIHCNRVDYSNLVLEARLLTLKDDGDAYLHDRAVDHAMECHLVLLDEDEGRIPSGHKKSLKRATRLAREVNGELRSGKRRPQETPLLDRWRGRSTDTFRAKARDFRRKGELPCADPETWDLWSRYIEQTRPLPYPFDGEE